MGRYSSNMREPAAKPTGVHPIWRGIGCLTIIITPVLAYAAAYITEPMFYNRGLIPNELLITPQVPGWLWNAPGLAQGVQFILSQPGILAMLVLTLMYILILGGILSVAYAMMYRMLAPSRYGPMDAPPPKVKVKKYTR